MHIKPQNIQLKNKRNLYFLEDITLAKLIEIGSCELIFLGNKFGTIKVVKSDLVFSKDNQISQFCNTYLKEKETS